MSRRVIRKLVRLHGEAFEKDIARGVKACKRVWGSKNGDEEAFEAFCVEQYAPPGDARNALLERLDEFHHVVSGSVHMPIKTARAAQDMADRPLPPAESVLAAFSPATHLQTDYRDTKVSALVQLNFGESNGVAPRSRESWAAERLGDVGRDVVPAKLQAGLAKVNAEVDRFVSAYNLHLDRITFDDPAVTFPAGTRLISHWGLRDYMTSLNGQADALPKQRAILDLMRRVVDGEIPAEVLDDPEVAWDIPRDKITRGKKSSKAAGHGALRWEKFRKVWKTQLLIDPYRRHGNLIDDKFLVDREIPEKTVVRMLTEIVSSPHAERVGRYVRDRLGRDLEPFDVYYRGFAAGARRPPLGYDIKKKYPNTKALHDAIPSILTGFGWEPGRAAWIASKIRVDNARSAGHAWPPSIDHDIQLLRLRVDDDGCSELGFETFMHELGHCVEGVLSSYEMDYKVLWGLPNTAFSEGFAFTFEDRGDEVLERPRATDQDPLTLVRFWEPFEIAGPALAEIRLYHWLYKHRKASAIEIQKAIRSIGDEIWADHYARIFGEEGHGLLSVYSHMLWGDFYLAEYPLGYVIAYQLRRRLKNRPLGEEMERICKIGKIKPEDWMKAAIGEEISVQPLLDDTAAALDQLGY